MKRFPLILLMMASICFPVLCAKEQESVFFIGNSLTMSLTLDRVHGLFAQRGIDLQFGSQLSGGKSLLRHLNYQKEPNQKWSCWETSKPAGETFLPDDNFYVTDPKTWRFGRYDTALVSHHWNALVMQPFQSSIKDDMAAIPAFIELALRNLSVRNFYIYQTWPRRPTIAAESFTSPRADSGPNDSRAANIDYADLWTRDYVATIEQTDNHANAFSASRDYFQTLITLLRKRFPDLNPRVRLIPAGEVLFVIDAKIKTGELPGLKELAERNPGMLPGLRPETDFSDGANVLYADSIHLSPLPHQKGTVGNFIMGTTVFTVLSGQNPVGLSGIAYGFDSEKDASLVKAIQETIWDVVTAEPMTGITD